jgi:cation diffusion facilitator CzcD-associated flavoprotein CzcO
VTTSTDHDSATLWRDGRPVYDRGETVCVVGAGPSGLVAVKNLKECGFGVDCYERETGVGGGWNWRHDRSPVYGSAHLISSKPFTQYPDFPMPDEWPDYPHHSQVLSYLERYADHFDLRPHVWFGTEVVKVEPADGMRWDVTTRSTGGYGAERTHRYAAVVVANGHTASRRTRGSTTSRARSSTRRRTRIRPSCAASGCW